jgi:hypothetical protein
VIELLGRGCLSREELLLPMENAARALPFRPRSFQRGLGDGQGTFGFFAIENRDGSPASTESASSM